MYRLLWHLQETAAWCEWIGLLLVGSKKTAGWDEVRLTRREDDER